MSAQLVDGSAESTREDDTSNTRSQNLYLPEAVMIDILSRVPINSILHCRCVCSSWNNLFLDPYFRITCAVKINPTVLSLVSFNLWFGESEHILMIKARNRSIHVDGLARGEGDIAIEIANSCNGLLCLMRNKVPICVWSPIGGGEYIPLPEITTTRVSEVTCGSGFSNKDKKYKVIRIYESEFEGRKTIEAEVCTLGSDTWRRIETVPYKLSDKFDAVYVNGALHWNIEDHHDFSQLICSFEIYTERFSSLPPPPVFSSTEMVGRRRRYDWSNLGVLDGCLYICAIDNNPIIPRAEIWVMKEYGMKGSWVKRFVLKYPIPEWWRPFPPFHILKVSGNGAMLLHCGDDKLRSYNYEEQRDGVSSLFQDREVLVERSFVSIKEIEPLAPILTSSSIPSRLLSGKILNV